LLLFFSLVISLQKQHYLKLSFMLHEGQQSLQSIEVTKSAFF